VISAACECGVTYTIDEAELATPVACRKCGRVLRCVSAEALDPGGGAADFDARLIVEAGPSDVGQQLLLGGVPDLLLGKLPDCQICLAAGGMVSRHHCRLSRVDFGPSRWKVVDNKSTNGLFVNGQRVTEHELQHDDELQVGEYKLRYLSDAQRPAPAAAVPVAMPAAAAGGYGRVPTTPLVGGGPPGPSCDQPLAPGAKICVRCGIYAATGRPLITAQGLDEDALYVRAETWIKFVSWLIPITPLPMPLASEAYGARKPYAIWAIASLTALISIVFFAAQNGQTASDTKNLMLWNPKAQGLEHFSFVNAPPRVIKEVMSEMDSDERAQLQQTEQRLKRTVPPQELRGRALDELYADQIREAGLEVGTFHPYQLLSHALLHDTSSILEFAFHLGGNLLFMLVFGSRVNSLIGNIATAVAYPVLAVCAAAVYLASLSPDHTGPMLGASGAIQGLAGMYLILFPVHRVYCAMWLRIRWSLFAKVFTLRGFWVLLIYFCYDVTMQVLSSKYGDGGGGVAHWAHIGGFLTGVVLALGILLSRQFNCRGADLLSVVLGRHAWPLIGKPSRWGDRTAGPSDAPMAVAAVPRHPAFGSVPQRL
jgi:membrane associated rhomboid family serine protease